MTKYFNSIRRSTPLLCKQKLKKLEIIKIVPRNDKTDNYLILNIK